MSERTATMLVLLTAFVSGFSIFLNKFAVTGTNPFVFTTVKNIFAAVFLLSIIFLFREFSSLRKLSRKNWLQLATIGLVGGSIPFLIYFHVLQQTSAINAGFLHKTIFVFASVFAFFFLKEKISKLFVAAAALLLAGNYFLFSRVSAFGPADLLVVAAVLLWAIENVLAKRFLQQKELNGKVIGFGRMFFGSAFMLLFLFATGQARFIAAQTASQWQWSFLAAIPLFFYVAFYYTGLKEMPVHKATALLMLGQPITVILSSIYFNKAISSNEALGILLTLLGTLLLFGFGFIASRLEKKQFNIIKTH